MKDISDEVWKPKFKAVNYFTDREEPTTAFKNKYNAFYACWKEKTEEGIKEKVKEKTKEKVKGKKRNASFCIMQYYGKEGIGKSSLLKKLYTEAKEMDCDRIYYDFKESNYEMYSLLKAWRIRLGELNNKFNFIRFDAAYERYYGKSEERQGNGNGVWDALSIGSTIAGVIPQVTLPAALLQAASTLVPKIVKPSKKFPSYFTKKDYEDFEEEFLSEENIPDNLHVFFMLDMRDNMQYVAEKPLLFFLDNYDNYTDFIRKFGNNSQSEDEWLRGESGVMQSIMGVYWVIAGKNRLFGKEVQEEAEKETQSIEDHSLGVLSEKDSVWFLEQSGISDEALRVQLYHLTNGVPMYLDRCVDTYSQLIRKEVVPVITDFGQVVNEVLEKSLNHKKSNEKEMICFLACLGKWTNEFAKEVALKTKCYGNKIKEFEKIYAYVMEQTFISQNSDGSYYMHELLAEAALKQDDTVRDLRKEVTDIKLSIWKALLDNQEFFKIAFEFSGYSATICDFVESFVSEEGYVDSYGEYSECLKTISAALNNIEVYAPDLTYILSKRVYSAVMKRYPDKGVGLLATVQYGRALAQRGVHEELRSLVSDLSIEEYVFELKGEKWLYVLETLGGIYSSLGEYETAHSFYIKAYEHCETNGLLDSPEIIQVWTNLACSFQNLGLLEDAAFVFETLLDGLIKIFGTSSVRTLGIIGRLCVIYRDLGREEDAYAYAHFLMDFMEREEEIQGLIEAIQDEENLDVLWDMEDLADIYDELCRYEEGLFVRKMILEKTKQEYGEECKEAISAMNDIFYCLWALERKEEALEYLIQIVEISGKVFGDSSSETLDALEELADFYSGLGKEAEANKIREQIMGKS